MASRSFLTVVVPLCEQAAIVESFVDDLCAVLRHDYPNHEVVLVDDWSRDNTMDVVSRLLKKHPAIRMLRLSQGSGGDIAVTAGLEASIGDIVVVMRPDCDPPSALETLLAPLAKDKDLNIVVGRPTNARREGLVFRALRAIFSFGAEQLSGVSIPRTSTSFIALTRKAVNAITRVKQKQRYLPWLCCSVGFKQTEVAYEQVARGTAQPRRGLRESFDLGVSSLVTTTTSPLRWVSYAGLVAAGLNLAYVGYVCGVNLFKDHVAEGWTTLSLQASSMFFMVFVIQAVMSEYVGRILDEAKERPLYHIVDELGSPVAVYDPTLRNVQENSTEEPVTIPAKRAA
jgi:glycosyltransferase involved in cell wall biosynthesis